MITLYKFWCCSYLQRKSTILRKHHWNLRLLWWWWQWLSSGEARFVQVRREWEQWSKQLIESLYFSVAQLKKRLLKPVNLAECWSLVCDNNYCHCSLCSVPRTLNINNLNWSLPSSPNNHISTPNIQLDSCLQCWSWRKWFCSDSVSTIMIASDTGADYIIWQ